MISTSYEILAIEEEGQEPHKEVDGYLYVEHDSPRQEKKEISSV